MVKSGVFVVDPVHDSTRNVEKPNDLLQFHMVYYRGAISILFFSTSTCSCSSVVRLFQLIVRSATLLSPVHRLFACIVG